MLPQRHEQIHGLTGLRGIACLAVFLVHFQQQCKIEYRLPPFDLGRLLENGNTGVALFFALSGFLLSIPFWEARGSGAPRPSPFKFFARRLARIVPAYYLCLTALIVANRLWLEDDSRLDMTLHYLFAFNFREDSIFSINAPFWTIAVETQFYALLPCIFVLIRPTAQRLAIPIVLLLALLAYGMHLQLIAAGASWPSANAPVAAVRQYSLLAHLPIFLFGIAATPCYLYLRQRQRDFYRWLLPVSNATVWGVLGLLLVVLGTPLGDALRVPAGRYHLPIVPILICSILVFTPFSGLPRAILDTRLFTYLGTVSYGIYLYHLPIQHVVARYMNAWCGLDPASHWIIFASISFLVTLITASISYWGVERRFLLWCAESRTQQR